jgi:hypothetical protein
VASSNLRGVSGVGEVRRTSGKKGRLSGRLIDWVDRVQKRRGGRFRGE